MSVIKLISTLALVIVGGFVALTTPYNDFSIAAMRDGIRKTFRDATAFVKQARINPVSVLSPKKDSVAATLSGVSDRTGQSARGKLSLTRTNNIDPFSSHPSPQYEPITHLNRNLKNLHAHSNL
jgi:hypothetical protein